MDDSGDFGCCMKVFARRNRTTNQDPVGKTSAIKRDFELEAMDNERVRESEAVDPENVSELSF